MSDPALIADLIRAGVAPELVARVAAAIADARAEGAIAKARTEARLSNDRERKARQRASMSRDKANDVSRDITGSHGTDRDKPGQKSSRARAFTLGEEVDITPLGRKRPTLPKGSGDDGAQARARVGGSRLPTEWVPSNALCDFGRGLGFDGKGFDEAVAEFRDYWRGVPGQRGRKLDWDATFRNRLRATVGKKRGNGNGNGKRGSISDVAPGFIERIDKLYAERASRSSDSGAESGPTVRLLPPQRREWP
jgi:hypothetical protein